MIGLQGGERMRAAASGRKLMLPEPRARIAVENAYSQNSIPPRQRLAFDIRRRRTRGRGPLNPPTHSYSLPNSKNILKFPPNF
jgi:hypothetical protein